MNSLPTRIGNQESLFRKIRGYAWFWDRKRNRPSSVAFKEKRGLSFDRSWDRSDHDCIDYLNSHCKSHSEPPFKAVISINAGESRKISLEPKGTGNIKSGKNIYHATLFENSQGELKKLLSDEKRFQLCDIVKIHEIYN